MRVRITMPTKDGKRLKEQIVGAADTVEEDEFGSDEWEVVSPHHIACHDSSSYYHWLLLAPTLLDWSIRGHPCPRADLCPCPSA